MNIAHTKARMMLRTVMDEPFGKNYKLVVETNKIMYKDALGKKSHEKTSTWRYA